MAATRPLDKEVQLCRAAAAVGRTVTAAEAKFYLLDHSDDVSQVLGSIEALLRLY